ncbi:hypothetical protein L484_008707 [Morus notabilis]|uniref:Uncharacterized protein n=1 Tax=Morus notabilis TaxID=981085 RepID=W9R0V7_9ROSA|nr:hypothetical protein L484_008707 [Morus notabilis]
MFGLRFKNDVEEFSSSVALCGTFGGFTEEEQRVKKTRLLPNKDSIITGSSGSSSRVPPTGNNNKALRNCRFSVVNTQKERKSNRRGGHGDGDDRNDSGRNSVGEAVEVGGNTLDTLLRTADAAALMGIPAVVDDAGVDMVAIQTEEEWIWRKMIWREDFLSEKLVNLR